MCENIKQKEEYCETKQFVQKIPFPEDRAVTPLKYFPWLQDCIDSVYRKVEMNNLLRSKFSGTTVLGLFPEMDGKTVGKVVAGLKEKYPEGYWLLSSKGEIAATIKHYVSQINASTE